MNATLAQIFELHDECVQLCRTLVECLKQERGALIALAVEDLQTANLRKEAFIVAITDRKARLKTLSGGAWPALEGLEDVTLAEWEKRRAEWFAAWREVHDLSKSNQRFLKHSLRNLGMLLDNFKRLLGDSTQVYSAKGTRESAVGSGKVMEAKV